MSCRATISSSTPSSGASGSRLSGHGPPGELDRLVVRAEQRLHRGVQGEREGGQLGRRERTLAALGLVDGLPAPGLVQVLPKRLAQAGQR
jgi:hypothetical protein